MARRATLTEDGSEWAGTWRWFEKRARQMERDVDERRKLREVHTAKQARAAARAAARGARAAIIAQDEELLRSSSSSDSELEYEQEQDSRDSEESGGESEESDGSEEQIVASMCRSAKKLVGVKIQQEFKGYGGAFEGTVIAYEISNAVTGTHVVFTVEFEDGDRQQYTRSQIAGRIYI